MEGFPCSTDHDGEDVGILSDTNAAWELGLRMLNQLIVESCVHYRKIETHNTSVNEQELPLFKSEF